MADPAADQGTDTGFDGIDGEHRVQISLMTAFREAIGGGRGAAEAGEILDQLLDYSKMHFVSEQLLMRLYDYHDYEVHVADHDRMLQEMKVLCDSYRDGEAPFDLERVDTLIKGLIAHISQTDQPLGQYLGTLDRRSE